MSERFLITGAYGCIGAWTVRQLVREGVEVIGVDAGDDDRRVRDLLEPGEITAARFLRLDERRSQAGRYSEFHPQPV